MMKIKVAPESPSHNLGWYKFGEAHNILRQVRSFYCENWESANSVGHFFLIHFLEMNTTKTFGVPKTLSGAIGYSRDTSFVLFPREWIG